MKKVEITKEYCCSLNPTGGIFELGETSPIDSDFVKITSKNKDRSMWFEKRFLKDHDGSRIVSCDDCTIELNIEKAMFTIKNDLDECRCVVCSFKERYGYDIGMEMLKLVYDNNRALAEKV